MNDNKQIKALIAGLLANNEQRVNQLTRELVESMVIAKKDVVVEALRMKFNGVTDV